MTNKVKESPIEEVSELEEAMIDKEAEYRDKLVRLQAEFDNFYKRTEREKQDILINANAGLIFDLLKVLDNFEISLKHNDDEGVRLIYNELVSILEKNGLKVIDATGKFNPNLHEVLARGEGDEDGIILEEIQKGYSLNGKLLRASKVKISKAVNSD